ncbi:DUF6236 family protein [Phascolarctobacterium sp.]
MESIIYYPYISIEDGILLRNSILYWDKIRTIIPGDFYHNILSNELLYLENNGIYQPIDPRKFFNSYLYNSFEKELLKRIDLYNRKIMFPNRNITKKEEKRYEIIRWQKFNIYESKMTHSLINKLQERGYIKEISLDGITMEQKVAMFYMSILAKYLALYEQNIHERYVIGTNEQAFFNKPYNMRNFNFGQPKELCISYVLNDILPIPKMDVPLENIIWFRKEYEFELKKFKMQIKEFEKQLKQCSKEKDFNEVCYECREKIELESAKILKLMDKSKIEYFMSSVKALFEVDKSFVPALLGVFSAKYHSNELGLAIFSGLTLSLNAFKTYYDGERYILDNPFSYLYFAKKHNII